MPQQPGYMVCSGQNIENEGGCHDSCHEANVSMMIIAMKLIDHENLFDGDNFQTLLMT